MSRINRVPDGLQGLLGTKALGRNPSDLGQQVVPTLDLLNFYAQNIVIQQEWEIETPVAVGANVTGATITVPNGEDWLVYNVTGGVTALGIGVTAEFVLSFDLSGIVPGQLTPNILAEWSGPANGKAFAAAGQSYFLGWQANSKPMHFSSGTAFQIYCLSGGGGNGSFRQRVTYVPIAM